MTAVTNTRSFQCRETKHAYKDFHYARCKKRGNIPKELNCPDFAYGCGKGRSDAQKSAQDYANKVGDSGCAKYFGHCQINKYTGG